MKQEKIQVSTQDGEMNLHVYYPELTEQTPVPAIIVLQEAFGVNDNIRNICEKFAKDGFLAVAPELFHRFKSDFEINYTDIPMVMSALGSLTNDELHEDVKAAYDFIKRQKTVPVKSIGSIGFCMGGFTSILGACRLPLDFAISCYGGGISTERAGIGFMPFMNEFRKIECPVFLLYGEKDNSIPQEQVELVRGQLRRADREYEIKVYLGAGHAFLREGQPVYHPSAAAEAWKDIYSFLKPYR